MCHDYRSRIKRHHNSLCKSRYFNNRQSLSETVRSTGHPPLKNWHWKWKGSSKQVVESELQLCSSSKCLLNCTPLRVGIHITFSKSKAIHLEVLQLKIGGNVFPIFRFPQRATEHVSSRIVFLDHWFAILLIAWLLQWKHALGELEEKKGQQIFRVWNLKSVFQLISMSILINP